MLLARGQTGLSLSFILHVVCPVIEQRTKERKVSSIFLCSPLLPSRLPIYFCIQRALLSTYTTHRTFFFVFICIEMKAECVVFHQRPFFLLLRLLLLPHLVSRFIAFALYSFLFLLLLILSGKRGFLLFPTPTFDV